MSARCHPDPKNLELCFQEIRIQEGAGGSGRDPGFWSPLLIRDIPVFAWWLQPLERLQEAVGEIAPFTDRFLGDSTFSEGLGRVTIEDKVGFINKNGEYVIKPQFDSAGDFSEGLAEAGVGDRSKRKYGFIDKKGNWAIKPRFDRAGAFSCGLAGVNLGFKRPEGLLSGYEYGKWGFVDKTGKMVIEAKYDGYNPFRNGLAYMVIGSKYVYVDGKGNVIWTSEKGESK